jgi:hypothetical protein
LTVHKASLPDTRSRATVDRFEVFDHGSSEYDGWVFQEWRIRAFGVSARALLEGWYRKPDAAEPVIGRGRLKRCDDNDDADLDALGPLAEN